MIVWLVFAVGLPRLGRGVVLPGTASAARHEAESGIRLPNVVREEMSRRVTAKLAASTGG